MGDELVITGLVPAGQSRDGDVHGAGHGAAAGRPRAANTLACQPGDPVTCVPETTEHQVRELEVTKASDATPDSRPGDIVTYTVTAQNTGAGDYTTADPAPCCSTT